jgi:hypothetical protein
MQLPLLVLIGYVCAQIVIGIKNIVNDYFDAYED